MHLEVKNKPSGVKIKPSTVTGMGAIPQKKGVSFRVWAPFAEEVYVTGTFNKWSKDAHILCPEKNGYWSALVPEAKAGDEYKYVIHREGKELLKNDPYARQISGKTKNGVIYQSNFDWGKDKFTIPDYNDLVIYELHIGTFSPERDGKHGTLDGVRKKLPYLKQLGVNAIELMPLWHFPTTNSWGYNSNNPFAVEETYGGNEALKQLVKEAHATGIAVILDVAYNHFGPDELDLWQFDGWSENNRGGIYFYNDWRSWTPWGENRPDYGRGEVRQFLRDNAIMWLEDFRVDGLRFDATGFIHTVRGNHHDTSTHIPDGWSLLQWINEEVRKLFPKRITIAEDLQINEWITKPTGAGGAGFLAQWDAAFVHPLRAAVINIDDKNRDMGSIKNLLYHRYNDDAFQRVIYSESHDEVANGHARIPYEIDVKDSGGFFAKKRSALAAGFVFTTPGIPMIFNGQELLEDEWFRDDVAIDWEKLESFRGINRLYRDLIHLRRNTAGQTAGLTGQHIHVNHVDYDNKFITFHRWKESGPGDDVMVVANFSNQSFKNYALGVPKLGMWRVRFNSDWKGYSENFDNFPTIDTEAQPEPLHGMPLRALLDMGPYSLAILSQDRKSTAKR